MTYEKKSRRAKSSSSRQTNSTPASKGSFSRRHQVAQPEASKYDEPRDSVFSKIAPYPPAKDNDSRMESNYSGRGSSLIPSPPQQVLMKTIDGRTKPLRITPDRKIGDLKKQLGHESNDVYLTHEGKVLKDELTVADYSKIQKDSTLEVRGRLRGGIPPTNEAVPPAFQKNELSSVNHIESQQQLEELLKSYEFDPENPQNKDEISKFWNKIISEGENGRSKYNSAPRIIAAFAPGHKRQKKEEEIIEKVNKNNADLAPEVSPGEGTTLERGDTRDKDELVKEHGFHGRGGSMSVEHARKWAKEWNKKTKQEKNDWLQKWKAETSPKSEGLPYVATGKECQKAGHKHTFEVPKKIECDSGDAKLVFDGDNLEDSNVIAITGRNEVVFLTGVPDKYIK